MNILQELNWRGLLKQVTNEEKVIAAQNAQSGVYCGFDPTGDSLHVGHLIQLILLKRFALAGFKPIAILGGGTGMIGDPSGKKAERKLLSDDTVNANVVAIKKQIQTLIPEAIIVNNNDWLGKISLIEFLRDVGKYFNINYLLDKENIATRLSTGLSFTEFSYTLLQARDFYQLYLDYGCWVEVGGSDQWGNIISGIDFISKLVGDKNHACGLTMHLLTKSDGTKFGKTESGAIWLDARKTSVYEFYQFFYNQSDQETLKLLRSLTFESQQSISQLWEEHLTAPFKRLAQLCLAECLTEFVHGKDQLLSAQQISLALFKNEPTTLSVSQLNTLASSLSTTMIKTGTTICDGLLLANVVQSKREAREFLEQGAITMNGVKISNENLLLTPKNALHKTYFLIRRGKKNYYLLKLIK